MEDSQEKDCSFLFPNLYYGLVYEPKFKSEYLERQIYERSLKSEPSIVKLIGNKRLLLRVEEHRTRHQNGIGKRETLSLIYDKCMQPGSRNRDKLMH